VTVAVLLDLLMATMDTVSTWSSAARDRERGLAWRDAVTERMIAAGRYMPYDDLVIAAAVDLRLPPEAPSRLRAAWSEMRPWPDVAALTRLRVPFAFVTNCSTALAGEAAQRSGLEPAFTLSAEESGWYKPRPEMYRLACDRMGAAVGEVDFVAGAPYDALGASAAGLRATLVARRPPAGQLPSRIAVVSSLAEALSVG
jgi:2-haloalkanoic acid dehalogenase type II